MVGREEGAGKEKRRDGNGVEELNIVVVTSDEEELVATYLDGEASVTVQGDHETDADDNDFAVGDRAAAGGFCDLDALCDCNELDLRQSRFFGEGELRGERGA